MKVQKKDKKAVKAVKPAIQHQIEKKLINSKAKVSGTGECE